MTSTKIVKARDGTERSAQFEAQWDWSLAYAKRPLAPGISTVELDVAVSCL